MPANREFLRYLNDWFYKDLSDQSHLGALGLMKRAGFLLHENQNNPMAQEFLQKFRHIQASQTICLILALVSEIEAYFRFGLAERASYLWVLLRDYSPVSKELYEKRYSDLLSKGRSGPSGGSPARP